MNIRTHRNDFSQGSIAKNILSLAIPLTVAQLTVVLYNVVDRAFIGHIQDIGRDAFTGIGLIMPVTYIITAFANLCGTGGAPSVPSPGARAIWIWPTGSWAAPSPFSCCWARG